MRNFLYKMERKYGKYAIKNLPLVLIICYAFGYLMQLIKPEFEYVLTLNPDAIVHGQVWRLFSWILVPPGSLGFLTIIMLYFYYSIGRTLERTWGPFLFNVYVFSGMLFTVIGSFILYVIIIFNYPADAINYVGSIYGEACPAIYGGNWLYIMVFQMFSTYYVNMSIFLAFAMMYPDTKVYLFFVIPIKMKVMGIVYVVLMVYEILMAFFGGGSLNLIQGFTVLTVIGSSLMNTIVFFFLTRKGRIRSPKDIKRQHEFKAKVRKASNMSRHKCAICGRTEEDDPNLTFRFCSKCDGNYEYCSEHIYTHEHIKNH